ncbi:hypothetical protein [Lactococcus kimchii]|uniref:hypothetical protein n=1 Tax=Lactococcus sp. S-13 TaxID=2507158 RepID=UPI001022C0A3|nr:hypothetical protein [Lactococcus sp. S-13]RZI49313.1 hypothetical protein EQJ87_07580 [Lactococcus sp. S-13]
MKKSELYHVGKYRVGVFNPYKQPVTVEVLDDQRISVNGQEFIITGRTAIALEKDGNLFAAPSIWPIIRRDRRMIITLLIIFGIGVLLELFIILAPLF